MQYVEIAPNTKTSFATQTFTYKIPPEILPNLKIGSLVLIPFHNRQIEGIVLKFQKLKGHIKEEKLKYISKLLEPEPVLGENHLKLARWMADYYFAGISQCLFEMIPIPPKCSHRSEQQTANITDSLSPLSSIITLCKRAISKNRQVIFLFPDIKQVYSSFSLFQKYFKNQVIVYHGQLNKSQRFQTWQKIKQQKYNIVIGSHLALFAPLERLGLIIIQDEESESYKNDRTPRYNIKTVAEKLAEITSAKLILISSTPSVETYYRNKLPEIRSKKNFYLIRSNLIPNNLSSTTDIIDMNQEIQKRNFSSVGESLQDTLQRTYDEGGKSILFINRRGAASYIFCRGCGNVLRCPNCNLPLIHHISPNSGWALICHHCSFKTKAAPSLCPHCGSLNLKFGGSGTQKLETEIKKIIPEAKILRIDTDIRSFDDHTSFDIIIGTQKLFSYQLKPVDLVAIISIDSILNLPDFRQSEKVFSIINRFRSLAKKSFVIQTHHPQNTVIQSALKEDYGAFYQKELESRKKLEFPPFSRLIRIICQSKKEDKCNRDMAMVADKLKGKVEILGPSPCFYTKIRGKFRWQFVLKIPLHKSLTSPISRLIRTLPSDWIVDVDPVTLL